MNKKILFFITLICIVFLTGCLAGPNIIAEKAEDGVKLAGFIKGLWHGIIAPITFIISIFTSKINMYEVMNNGLWYDLGFVLGAGILFGGSGKVSRNSCKRRGKKLNVEVNIDEDEGKANINDDEFFND